MIFKKKQKPAQLEKILNPQAGRYNFDFSVIPSVFAHASLLMFTPECDDKGFWEGSLDSGMCEYMDKSERKLYDISEGQVGIWSFPPCDYSPSVVYGIGILRMADFLAAEKSGREYSAPYYALVKILDGYVVGKIYDDGNGSYITEYYEKMDNADQVQFLKWVMEKEQLSIEGSGDAPNSVRAISSPGSAPIKMSASNSTTGTSMHRWRSMPFSINILRWWTMWTRRVRMAPHVGSVCSLLRKHTMSSTH